MRRRYFLGLLSASTLSVSGCLNSRGPGDAIVRAAPDAQSDTETTIQYRDLPKDEQTIAQTAIEDEFYHACPELPDAVRSFANRFPDYESAYLTHQGTVYALWIRIKDIVEVSTASRPEENPSCGLL